MSTLISWGYHEFITTNNTVNNNTLNNLSTILVLIFLAIFFIYLMIRFFVIYITIASILFIWLSNWNIIKIFFEFLYPLYWLSYEYIKNFNSIELAGIIIYKWIYAILLWHLIIALKRTTKR
jgi:hypothetical protein